MLAFNVFAHSNTSLERGTRKKAITVTWTQLDFLGPWVLSLTLCSLFDWIITLTSLIDLPTSQYNSALNQSASSYLRQTQQASAACRRQ